MIILHVRMDGQEESMTIDTEDTPLQACWHTRRLLEKSHRKPHRFQVTARDEPEGRKRRGAQIRFQTL